jgi:hypothetical protein
LDERIQRKVASGIMPPAEAVKLLKLAPEKVQEVVEAIPEIEEPIIDFDPESIPLDDSGSNESLQPATKPKRTEEEIKEDKKKTEKAYQSSRESNKKAAKKAAKTAVKAATKSSGAKSSRTLAELNAAIKGREDRASKAILRFMSEEWNELELNTELDDIEDALANTVDA